MLARNPHLTFTERQVLWKDKDQYVRRSLAGNIRLSHEEMSMIIRKQPNTVLVGLAMNPVAPRETLLQLFDEMQKRNYNQYWCFAWNPYCPQEIINQIITKKMNPEVLGNGIPEWVRITQGRKEEYRQLKAQGKPFPHNKDYYWSFADLWWRDEDNDQHIISTTSPSLFKTIEAAKTEGSPAH